MKTLIPILLLVLLIGWSAHGQSLLSGYQSVVAKKKAAGGGGTDPGTANLVGYYRFESNLTDSSGNGYDLGEDDGTVTYASGGGQHGDAINQSSSDIASRSDSGAEGPFDLGVSGGNFSISTWVYLTSIPASNQYVISKWMTDSNQRGWAVYVNPSGEVGFLMSSDGTGTSASVVSSDTLSATTWHHVVVTYEAGTEITVRIDNGTPTSNTTSIPASLHDSTASFLIGAVNTSSPSFPLVGRQDTTRIYSDLLTSAEITYRYNNE